MPPLHQGRRMADAGSEVKLYAFDTRQDASFNPLFTTISALYRQIKGSGIAGMQYESTT
jgi:hypothetical protein